MYRSISILLDKMGNWFGIIFKILLPLVLMYRPLKTLALSIVVFGTYYGGSPASLNSFAIGMFWLMYVVFLVLLIFSPKVASACEFFLIAYYMAFILFIYHAGVTSNAFESLTSYLITYIIELPFILLFLTGKIIFFFFIRHNRMNIEKMKSRDNQMLYHSRRTRR